MNGQMRVFYVYNFEGGFSYHKVHEDSRRPGHELVKDDDGYLMRHYHPNRHLRRQYMFDPIAGWVKKPKKGPRGLVGVR